MHHAISYTDLPTHLLLPAEIQNAIDRDQKAMEVQLGDKSNASFENAKAIYEQGGNSKTFAVLTIPGGLTVSVGKGDEVFGTNEAGLPIQGKVYEAASSSETTLKVQYLTGDSQASYSDCQVGGLVETNTVGCKYNTILRRHNRCVDRNSISHR